MGVKGCRVRVNTRSNLVGSTAQHLRQEYGGSSSTHCEASPGGNKQHPATECSADYQLQATWPCPTTDGIQHLIAARYALWPIMQPLTANVDDAPVFAVQVEQGLPREHGGIQRHGPHQAYLLLNSKQGLNGRARHVRGQSQHGKNSSHTWGAEGIGGEVSTLQPSMKYLGSACTRRIGRQRERLAV